MEGATVRMAAPAMFEHLVTAQGVEFYPIPLDPWGAIKRVLGQRNTNLLTAARAARNELTPLMQHIVYAYYRACHGADAVVYSPVGFLGRQIARDLGLPTIGAVCQPVLNSTGAFPSAFTRVPTQRLWWPENPLLSAYNRLTYTLSQQLVWAFLRTASNTALGQVKGLSTLPIRGHFKDVSDSRDLILNGWSPWVLPSPPDWGDNLPVTGYWVMPKHDQWTPPAGLTEFLESRPSPIVIGFGSISEQDPRQLRDLLVAALQHTSKDAIVLTGWSGLSEMHFPDNIYAIPEAPHDWLFSRADVVVHHGGAGTTGASLRSGKPTVVVPWYADQPFWSSRVEALGVGLSTSLRKKVSPKELGDAIHQASNHQPMRARAKRLGESLRAEDGTGTAARRIHDHLSVSG